jgi:hypothetical protein
MLYQWNQKVNESMAAETQLIGGQGFPRNRRKSKEAWRATQIERTMRRDEEKISPFSKSVLPIAMPDRFGSLTFHCTLTHHMHTNMHTHEYIPLAPMKIHAPALPQPQPHPQREGGGEGGREGGSDGWMDGWMDGWRAGRRKED